MRCAVLGPIVAVSCAVCLLVVGCSAGNPGRSSSVATQQAPTTSYIDPIYKDVEMISAYNDTHPGTFERFNEYEFDGRTHEFFDSSGKPNLGIIKAHLDAFIQGRDDIIPIGFSSDYFKQHGYN
ncbi:hypothetical protein ACFXHA_11370 [Nocardia sp. NPDC059240]|uniref:hypothetical protein n=1 Tax=Nocardia sp. NPDC059240 TaxID=3346786 RepID=UPI00369D59EA